MTALTFISHEFIKASIDGDIESLVRTIAIDSNGEQRLYATYCTRELWEERGEKGIEKWIRGSIGYDVIAPLDTIEYLC